MSLFDNLNDNLNDNLHKANYDGCNSFSNDALDNDFYALKQAKQKSNPEAQRSNVGEIDYQKDDPSHDEILHQVDTETFVEKFKEVKALNSKTNPNAWRVADITLEEFKTNHPDTVCYLTPDNSTVAITKDGDIISVCRHPDDQYRGKEIIASAVANGGTKLDSYDGNHAFYLKCGFEPVSWCKWQDEFAPDDWKEGINDPEDIIFYKYTGKIADKEKDDFKSQVTMSASYDDACKIRDDSI